MSFDIKLRDDFVIAVKEVYQAMSRAETATDMGYLLEHMAILALEGKRCFSNGTALEMLARARYRLERIKKG